MDLTIAIGAGLYMITCMATNRFYIGQSDCLLYRLGRHGNDLFKNTHTDCPEMQKDFNTHGPQSFRFEALQVGNSQLNNKDYRLKREQEELEKYPADRLYNKPKPEGAPVGFVQRVRIHGKKFDSIRKAESRTKYSKTDIIRKLNSNEPGFERLEKVPIAVNRAHTVVIDNVIYRTKTVASEVCRMHIQTINKHLADPNNKAYQKQDETIHGDLPWYTEDELNE